MTRLSSRGQLVLPKVRKPMVPALLLAGGIAGFAGGCKKPSPPAEAAPDASGEAATVVDGGDPEVTATIDELRHDFGKKYSCPEDRVEVKSRPDIDPLKVLPRDGELSLGTAPAEVQNDPGRYAKWKADRDARLESATAKYAQNKMWEAAGCGHMDILACHPYVRHANGAVYTGGPPECQVIDKRMPITLASLATEAVSAAWTPIDDPPPVVGGYRPFDVIANFDWATKVATVWSADAALYLVQVGNVPRDGTVDLSPTGASTVRFYFHSVSKGDVDLGIEVNPVSDRRRAAGVGTVVVEATPRKDTSDRKAVPKPTCTLPRALAALRDAGALAKADPAFGFDAEMWTGTVKSYWRVTYRQSTQQGFVKNTTSDHRDVNAETCAMEHVK